ncbi:hypothetical protein V2J09_015513 [Rumex salicifolius]
MVQKTGMGVVTASSSASRTPLGLDRMYSSHQSVSKKPFILAFKTNKPKKTTSVSPRKSIPLCIETTAEEHKKRLIALPSKGIQAVSANVASPYTAELDLNEAAAKLESIYKLKSASEVLIEEEVKKDVKRGRRRRRNITEDDELERFGGKVVRNKIKRVKRLSLDKRIELKNHSEEKITPLSKKKKAVKDVDEKITNLVREYSGSTDLVSLDWKKMKIPPVLSASEHAWLFNILQPMKTLIQLKENLQRDLGREPTDSELGEAVNITVAQVTKQMEVGRAARNKLIKVRVEIQKAKLQMMFELTRMPTEEEIARRVGISPERYREVMRASKSVLSLNSKHATTQEELVDGIADIDGVGGDKRKQPALLRLAIDDVLDSLKPKESLVIRQRYGLDGKGDRTLGEIAGNLNISREMVRKHEMKALMKLKHPARMDYVRQYIY